ncbi:hypothetical protein IJH10_01265 [Candidatus Saccharibacteria bacterium]|nr:hypothetical protein [Candidatus Saccharibacteria bacterium]
MSDIRDGETYRIRKLADGNCWMTENLRLKITEGQAIEISDGSMWMPTNYDGSTTNSTTLTANDVANLSTLWKCTSTGNDCTAIVRSLDTAGFDSVSICTSGGGSTVGTDRCSESASTIDGDTQKIGVYYNWYTSTAGTGIIESGTTLPSVSICPKNWQMPGGNVTTITGPTYRKLLNAYGITPGYEDVSEDMRKFPYSFITTGDYIPDYVTIQNFGAIGFYADKNSGHGSGDPDGIYLNNNKFQVGTGYARFTTRRRRDGTVIRCVAQ